MTLAERHEVARIIAAHLNASHGLAGGTAVYSMEDGSGAPTTTAPRGRTSRTPRSGS